MPRSRSGHQSKEEDHSNQSTPQTTTCQKILLRLWPAIEGHLNITRKAQPTGFYNFRCVCVNCFTPLSVCMELYSDIYLADTQHRVCSLWADTQHRVCSLRADTQHRVCSLWVDTQHRVCSLWADTQHRVCSLRADTQHRVCSLRADTQHRVCSLRADTQHRVCSLWADTQHRVCSLWADTQHRVCSLWAHKRPIAYLQISLQSVLTCVAVTHWPVAHIFINGLWGQTLHVNKSIYTLLERRACN